MQGNAELLGAREVATLLGLNRKRAMQIMRNEMRTIQTGRNPRNPRYKTTIQEIERWKERSAGFHAMTAKAPAHEDGRKTNGKPKEFLIPRRPYK